MIGMLVRNQDGVQLFRFFADGGEPRQDIAFAETGVDKNARFFGSNESGVSGAATGEDANLNYDAPPELPR